jgi:hypothetical protein
MKLTRCTQIPSSGSAGHTYTDEKTGAKITDLYSSYLVDISFSEEQKEIWKEASKSATGREQQGNFRSKMTSINSKGDAGFSFIVPTFACQTTGKLAGKFAMQKAEESFKLAFKRPLSR